LTPVVETDLEIALGAMSGGSNRRPEGVVAFVRDGSSSQVSFIMAIFR
jgi:hypothetical protein